MQNKHFNLKSRQDLLRKQHSARNRGQTMDEKQSLLGVNEHRSPSLTMSSGARRHFAEGLQKRRVRTVLTHPLCFIAFGFGAGLSKVAPGTCGTVVAIPAYYWLLQSLSPFSYGILLLGMTILGIGLCEIAERKTGIPDDPGIVWDEICGLWITLWGAPSGIIWIGLGFIFFRLFDIWKPWPIHRIDQHVQGGLGIMLDDVLAAVYAWLSLYGTHRLIGYFHEVF